MTKLAVLLPSRGRTEGLSRAFESWKRNSVQSDIFFCFQQNDAMLNANIGIVDKRPYILTGDIGFAAKVNLLCNSYPGYDAYMVLNDDQIIHTPEWDRLILDKLDSLEKESGHRFWIPFWKDGIQDGRLPQGFATKEMLEITGSYYPIDYMRHLFSDNVYQYIGEQCGILHYMPEVYIEHLHYTTGKSKFDASYAQTNSSEAWQRDEAAFKRWTEEKGKEIVRQIALKIYSLTSEF